MDDEAIGPATNNDLRYVFVMEENDTDQDESCWDNWVDFGGEG